MWKPLPGREPRHGHCAASGGCLEPWPQRAFGEVFVDPERWWSSWNLPSGRLSLLWKINIVGVESTISMVIFKFAKCLSLPEGKMRNRWFQWNLMKGLTAVKSNTVSGFNGDFMGLNSKQHEDFTMKHVEWNQRNQRMHGLWVNKTWEISWSKTVLHQQKGKLYHVFHVEL